MPHKGNRLKSNQKLMAFSFRDFDPTQGQTFGRWGGLNLLEPMLEKLREYSKLTIPEAMQSNFTIYDQFPPKSKFRHPRHIEQDAHWASLHIKGKECIAGHLLDNIFYVVFLDKDHEFWPSKLKHT
jgi:hypothetical protein